MLVRYTMDVFTNRGGACDVKAIPVLDGEWVKYEDLEAAIARALDKYRTQILEGLEEIG